LFNSSSYFIFAYTIVISFIYCLFIKISSFSFVDVQQTNPNNQSPLNTVNNIGIISNGVVNTNVNLNNTMNSNVNRIPIQVSNIQNINIINTNNNQRNPMAQPNSTVVTNIQHQNLNIQRPPSQTSPSVNNPNLQHDPTTTGTTTAIMSNNQTIINNTNASANQPFDQMSMMNQVNQSRFINGQTQPQGLSIPVQQTIPNTVGGQINNSQPFNPNNNQQIRQIANPQMPSQPQQPNLRQQPPLLLQNTGTGAPVANASAVPQQPQQQQQQPGAANNLGKSP
jgi:hypothetical protein